MKAVVYNGARDVRVEDVPEPRIEEPTDAIVRITSSGICGSDLHMYDGHTPAEPGIILGHEPMGVVEEVGDGVSIIKEGDRVVMPFNVACGTCYNCLRGYSSACLVMNPQGAGAAYGYVTMGPYRGAQAEMLRVPRADWACLKLPGRPGDDKEDDYVMLADVFPTAFHATEMAKVSSGKTVAVFGAGPVGLLSAYCSMLKGASEVYVVDRSPVKAEAGGTHRCGSSQFRRGRSGAADRRVAETGRCGRVQAPSDREVGRGGVRHRCCRLSGI